MVPPLLASPLPEPVDSSVVELEPVLLELLPGEPPMLESARPVEVVDEVIGGMVVNGDVSACDGWQASARPRARTMGRDRGRIPEV
ncbi:hypothetical protein [Nannocystis exedens]|uniref:hypothetical protein n=1 Tax=Nannocystis exedens TaxID=54 RepID=UPI0011606963|nr:hypothetical protein [Nannocystis exedens]